MTPNKNLPQLKGKIAVAGSGSENMKLYVKSLDMEYILSDGKADVLIVTQEGFIPKNSFDTVVYPYYKGFDKTALNVKKLVTYAVENNSADVVAKNIRDRDGFKTFELLAPDGIGRVYVSADIDDAPKLALALACGLMASGVQTMDAINAVSGK